jgi:hypothetical protein
VVNWKGFDIGRGLLKVLFGYLFVAADEDNGTLRSAYSVSRPSIEQDTS